MKVIMFLLALLCYVSRSEAVSCECNLAKCPPIEISACKGGVTKDICGCCSVCAGDVGERCGGPWGIFGTCAEDLDCKQNPCPSSASEVDCYLYYLTDPGTCVERKRHTILDILQGTHVNELSENVKQRRNRLLKELETLQKKKK